MLTDSIDLLRLRLLPRRTISGDLEIIPECALLLLSRFNVGVIDLARDRDRDLVPDLVLERDFDLGDFELDDLDFERVPDRPGLMIAGSSIGNGGTPEPYAPLPRAKYSVPRPLNPPLPRPRSRKAAGPVGAPSTTTGAIWMNGAVWDPRRVPRKAPGNPRVGNLPRMFSALALRASTGDKLVLEAAAIMDAGPFGASTKSGSCVSTDS